MKLERYLYLIVFGVLTLTGALTAAQGVASLPIGLNQDEKIIVDFVDQNMNQALSMLETLVNINSGTANIPGVKKVGEVVKSSLDKLGFSTRWVDFPSEFDRAGHLVATRTGKKGKRLLLIGHLDTVFEPDRQNVPFSITGRRAIGDGVYDMKGGVVAILQALEALNSSEVLKDHTITVIFMGDEEKAARPIAVSRKILIDMAKQSDIALGFEFGTNNLDSTAVVSRRGISRWILDVSAKSGHSSKIFQEDVGGGAIVAMAEVLQSLKSQLVLLSGLTFNPGIVLGGTELNYDAAHSQGNTYGKANVIASRAMIEGDLRFVSGEQELQAQSIIRKEEETDRPHVVTKVKFVEGYPAMSDSIENRKLLQILSQVSKDLGGHSVSAVESTLRGAADISFAAPYVTASLDGLGAIGGGAHTSEEWLDLDAYPTVIKRTALLIYRLLTSFR